MKGCKGGITITRNDDARPTIYIISDSIGETAELVARAAESQFDTGHVEIRRVPYVTHPDEIRDVVEEAGGFPSVILFTIVLDELRQVLIEEAKRYAIPTVDVISPVIRAITAITGEQPRMEPGLMRKVDEDYFRRIEAIEFAVKYDDGKDPRGILQADLVVLGVSRTGKTPLCMYLAHKQIKPANIPLVPEVKAPEELFKLSPHKVIGLSIRPNQLADIRTERLRSLGLPADADYANGDRILKELAYAKDIYQRLGCSVIDVTNKAVEETAGKVLEAYFKGERYRSGM